MRQDYDQFWNRTPREVVTIIKAARGREERDYEQSRTLQYELANLIIFAQHDPKKMPEYKPLNQPAKKQSTEAESARARGALIAMALASGH